ncbi:MAG TPA: formylglycine-generating enzyme family protein [Xanthobacteraceae bacterium]|nr:formylglycine-generating enzyme family protein [Xanthobacteraceae bacterium]
MKTPAVFLLVVALAFGAVASASATALEMVRIAGGAFMMGSDRGPADERPMHRVEMTPFFIDRRPVTNAEFAEFLNAIGGTRNDRGQNLFDWDDGDARIHKVQARWRPDRAFENHPAIEMSWYGARDYCTWKGKRLPTEAEREFAARGAEGRTYPWGEAPPDATRARFASGWGRTVVAGSLRDGATPEGVLDLAGNVHEWTSSIARPYPYRADDGRENPDEVADRVTRGGAADTGPETLRATWRGATVSRRATVGHHNIGFRCARDAE